jgi:hypothetical protein
MVESAYRYLKAAIKLRRGHDMLDIAQINAAIGMEILLKSFISKPDDKLGQVMKPTNWTTMRLRLHTRI